VQTISLTSSPCTNLISPVSTFATWERVGANGSLAPPTNERTYAVNKEDLFPGPMTKK